MKSKEKQLRKKLERARSGLKIIHTWAAFMDGRELVPKHVINLTLKILAETEEIP